MSFVPRPLCLQYFIAFVVEFMSKNKFLKHGKHFRSLFKTAGADKTCGLHYFRGQETYQDYFTVMSSIFVVSLTHAGSLLKFFTVLLARPISSMQSVLRWFRG